MADVIDIKTRKKQPAKAKDATKAKAATKAKTWQEEAAEEALGPFAHIALKHRREGILDFDWEPLVTRIEVVPGIEAADKLKYTAAGRKKFGEVFIDLFGFPRLPVNYGELWALYDYCGAMDDSARRPDGLADTAKYWPDTLPIFMAYQKGDIFTLRRAHTEEFMIELTRDAWK